jgi:hypothetical protein
VQGQDSPFHNGSLSDELDKLVRKYQLQYIPYEPPAPGGHVTGVASMLYVVSRGQWLGDQPPPLLDGQPLLGGEFQPLHLHAEEAFSWDSEVYQDFMVRQCYPELLETIDKLRAAGKGRVLLSGTPGAGKSMLQLYAVKKYSEDKRKIVAYHSYLDPENVYILAEGHVFFFPKAAVKPKDVLAEPNVIYLIDSTTPILTSTSALMVVSPRKKSSDVANDFKKGITQAALLYMPLWFWSELAACLQLCYTGTTAKDEWRRSWAKPLYEVYGGVPRLLFQLPDAAFDQKLLEAMLAASVKGIAGEGLYVPLSTSSEDLAGGAHSVLRMMVLRTKPAVGAMDAEQLYVDGSHSFPPYDPVGDTNPFSRRVYCFSSGIVTKMVSELRVAHVAEKLKEAYPQFMHNDQVPAGEKGWWYEAYVRKRLMSPSTLFLRGKRAAEPAGVFNFLLWHVPRSLSSIMFYSAEDLPIERKPKTLLVPKISNFPAIDFVFGSSLIQVTTAKKHSFQVTTANAKVILHMDRVYGDQLVLTIIVESKANRDAFKPLEPDTEVKSGQTGWNHVQAALDVARRLPQHVFVLNEFS